MPNSIDFRNIFRHVTLQTALGGLAVYVASKQQGTSDTVAIINGVVSAFTSGLATAGGAQEGRAQTLLTQQEAADQKVLDKAKEDTQSPPPTGG